MKILASLALSHPTISKPNIIAGFAIKLLLGLGTSEILVLITTPCYDVCTLVIQVTLIGVEVSSPHKSPHCLVLFLHVPHFFNLL